MSSHNLVSFQTFFLDGACALFSAALFDRRLGELSTMITPLYRSRNKGYLAFRGASKRIA